MSQRLLILPTNIIITKSLRFVTEIHTLLKINIFLIRLAIYCMPFLKLRLLSIPLVSFFNNVVNI